MKCTTKKERSWIKSFSLFLYICKDEETVCHISRTGARAVYGLPETAAGTGAGAGRPSDAFVEELSPALASFVWSAQDTLAVHADGQGKAVRFNIQRGLGTASAQFVGTVKGNSLVALSPAVADAGLQGKQLSLTLPATQKYVSGNRLDGHAFPMLAVSETDELVFQSLEAVLVVPISGNATLSRIRIAAASNEMPLSGKATVRTDFSGAPALTMKEANATLVTLECKGVQLKGWPEKRA